MVRALFKMFNIWDSDDEDDLDYLRALAEELDADEAEEAANDERVRKPRVYLRRDHEEACHPTIVLEAVASYDTWIWHTFFGVAGANNDVNVLNQSSLFDDIKNRNAPVAPFTVNGNDYLNGYYLVDEIYPDWATLMKAYSTPTDEPRAKFKQFQESARKDVERTFDVLQGRFHILQMVGRPHSVNKLRRILYCCVLLHNMIVEDNGFNITWLEEELLATDEANPNYVRNRSTSRDVREQEIRDRNVHDQLRHDLTEHIWSLPPNFRTMNA
ncbi:protein ALP1-like [Rutidosis leptorrhynchoides]|uniref:protein ALP1-like n=1 Tax=Rutidosis leptorrhynchoides TaxID=125765 RepID=UPI003A98F82C